MPSSTAGVRGRLLRQSLGARNWDEAPTLANQLNDLLRVKDVESERLRTEAAKLTDARTRLADMQESMRQSLAERQAELAQLRQAIDAHGIERPPLAGFSGSPEAINPKQVLPAKPGEHPPRLIR